MAHTVAEELVAALAHAGVERVYGIVGDSLNPVTDAIRKSGAMRWIDVRHEEAAAFAAGAEAQLTGRLAVCAGSAGPGNLHLINGLYDAHRSLAPVLAIAAHIPSCEIGTEYFQETHPERLFLECSHYCELVSSPAQLPRMLHSALQHAVARNGVSVLVLPGDVAAMPAASDGVAHATITEALIRPCEDDIDRLAALLDRAHRVTLFCGVGCAGAHDEVVALADKLQAPIAYTFRGKEWMEYDNPFAVGMTGLLGWGAAYEAMHDCDVLMLLGTDFPYESFMPSSPVIVQIDKRPERLGRRSRLDLGLCGHVGETLRALLPRVAAKSDARFLDAMLEHHRHAEDKMRVYVDHVGKRRPIHPEHVAASIDALAGAEAIFTLDTGMCTVWGARYLHAARGRRLLGSFNHGSMANALPQAIGAQLAFPKRPVIALCGDGGLAMTLGELLTLRQYELPVKIVLFDNHSLAMVQLEQEVAGLPTYGTQLTNPDFAAVAAAIGFHSARVEDPGDVRPAIEAMLAAKGPALVDVVTDPHVLALPPRATVRQAKGFALSMTKMAIAGRAEELVDTVMANWRQL